MVYPSSKSFRKQLPRPKPKPTPSSDSVKPSPLVFEKCDSVANIPANWSGAVDEDTTRIVSFGDVHWTIRPPSSRRVYQEDLKMILGDALKLSMRVGAHATLCPGDLFHPKTGITVAEMLQLHTMLRGFGGLYVVPGNHDMKGNDLSTVSTDQPFGVLESLGSVIRIDNHTHREPLTLQRRDTRLLGVAYGAANHFSRYIYEVTREREGTANAVVLTHLDTPEFDKVVRELVQSGNSVVKKGGTIVVLNGHIHDADNVQCVNESTFGIKVVSVYLGAIARTSVAEKDVVPHAFVIDIEKCGNVRVLRVDLEHIPTDEAFGTASTDGDTKPFDESVGNFVALLKTESKLFDPLDILQRYASTHQEANPDAIAMVERLLRESA